MQLNQQLNTKQRFFCRATGQQRVLAAVVFMVIAGIFGLFALAAYDKVDIGWWLGPCGFEQRFGLPCPTSMLAFCRGKIIEAFYIQPAGALLYSILIVVAFLALFTAASGVYFEFIRRFFAKVKIRYIILALLVVIICGWAVTLARALAGKGL